MNRFRLIDVVPTLLLLGLSARRRRSRRRRLSRSGPRTLTLEPIDGQMLHSPAERLVRWRAEALAPGDTVSSESFTAEILATNELGPTRVAFHFERDLDDPAVILVVRDDTGWTRLDAPELGESVLLGRPSRS